MLGNSICWCMYGQDICLKITEDKSSENRVYIPYERLIIATRVMPRCRAWSPRLNISTVPRREGRSPRPSCTVNAKTQSMKPAPKHQYSTKTWGSKPVSQLHCNNQDAEPETHVWQSLKPSSSKVRSRYLKREARSPRSDYREAPRLGYNCPHYWVHYCPRNEGVNPHYGGFLGDSLTPWNPYK